MVPALDPLLRLGARVNRVVQYLSRDAFGGPRVLKLAWVINVQKAGTLPFIAALMWWYGNMSAAAWVYLGLHGGYGLSWLIKDVMVPDRGWQQRVTFGGAALSFLLVLAPYWVLPWLLLSGVLGPEHPQPTPALMAACIVIFTIGLTLMIGADAQKNATRDARPGLITTGFYARTRHPNYLGEMLIYASFALMVRHWIPWVILGAIWTFVFMTNIAAQEVSLSRYPEWLDYRKRTGLLLPRWLTGDRFHFRPDPPTEMEAVPVRARGRGCSSRGPGPSWRRREERTTRLSPGRPPA